MVTLLTVRKAIVRILTNFARAIFPTSEPQGNPAQGIYPDVTWQAEVESISLATGAEFAILPPQNNWVKVVQRLPVRLKLKPHADAPPLRAGMTATVTVDTKRERSVSDLFDIFTAKAEMTESTR